MDRWESGRIRSGDEPAHARSPLRLRLVLALIGLASTVVGLLFFSRRAPGLAVACAVVGVIALIDVAVIVRHIRQGPHYQPGRDIPPYRPVEVPSGPAPYRPPPTQRHRRRVYLVMMGLCLMLIINAWTWVRLLSTGTAVAMSAAAAVIPPFAAMLANAGGNRDDSWDEDPRR